jgi:prepilin-type processing-associated H-X9-DG protein
VYGYRELNPRGIWEVVESKRLEDLADPSSFVAVTEVVGSIIESEPDRFIAEGPAYSAHGATDFGEVGANWPADDGLAVGYSFRHGKTGNVAFADGHAGTISADMPCTAVGALRAVNTDCVELDDKYTLLWDGP